MFVAVARLTLSIPEAGSLKSKRHVVHKVLDKVKARFNVSIAEVADNDLWQKATLGIAAVANEHTFARETVDKVIRFIEELYVAPVVAAASEIVPLGDDLFGEDDGTSFGSGARGTRRSLAEAELGTVWRGERTLAEAEADSADREMPKLSAELERTAPRFRRPRSRAPGSRAPAPMGEAERLKAIDDLRRRLREGRRARAEEDEDDDPTV